MLELLVFFLCFFWGGGCSQLCLVGSLVIIFSRRCNFNTFLLWKSEVVFVHHTVDGRNPAPPNPVNNGIFTISTGAGFLPSTVL